MNVFEIGLTVLFPPCAVGYFGVLGLITAKSLISGKIKSGWKVM